MEFLVQSSYKADEEQSIGRSVFMPFFIGLLQGNVRKSKTKLMHKSNSICQFDFLHEQVKYHLPLSVEHSMHGNRYFPF